MSRRAGACVLLALPGAADAACADPVACACTIGTSNVAFGLYDPQAAAPTDSVGTLSVMCGAGRTTVSTFSITIAAGSAGDVRMRTLRHGDAVLRYNLYRDVTRTNIWGDSVSGGGVVFFARPGQEVRRDYPIYGRVFAGQRAAPGDYRDTIAITLFY